MFRHRFHIYELLIVEACSELHNFLIFDIILMCLYIKVSGSLGPPHRYAGMTWHNNEEYVIEMGNVTMWNHAVCI
jgi:hypothetical protein